MVHRAAHYCKAFEMSPLFALKRSHIHCVQIWPENEKKKNKNKNRQETKTQFIYVCVLFYQSGPIFAASAFIKTKTFIQIKNTHYIVINVIGKFHCINQRKTSSFFHSRWLHDFPNYRNVLYSKSVCLGSLYIVYSL